ncbi:MAG: ATP-binding protein [Anaerolineae bacterium]
MVNNKQEIFKGITSRAKSLLAREAGLDVEFKQAVDALAVEDLVAFANSAAGGSILIGVADAQTTDASKSGQRPDHGLRR